jgi:hypothetical protein
MATVGVTAGQSTPDINKQQETRQVHGLATPDGTPAPDDARIEADNARQQAESQSANAQSDPPNVQSRTGPESHSEHSNGKNEEDEKHEEDEEAPPTEEQIEAVNRVMKYSRQDYRNILGLKETYASEDEERQAVMDAFRELGFLVHIGYNSAKNARAAFQSKSEPSSFPLPSIGFC